MNCLWLLMALAALGSLTLSSSRLAAEPSLQNFGSRTDGDLEAAPPPTHEAAPYLSFGAQLTLDFETEQEFDLDTNNDDDRITLEPELGVSLSFDPSEHLQVFIESEIRHKFSFGSRVRRSDREVELSIEQAYLHFTDIPEGLSLQLGRQDFEDSREWLFDEQLDAARLFLARGPFEVEFSVSREELLRKDLLSDERRDKVDNYALIGRFALGEEDGNEGNESEFSAYAIFRDDREPNPQDLLFVGLQANGDLAPNLGYWGELSHVRSTLAPVDVRGFGGDVGITYVFDAPYEPSLTLGAAFGTGDKDEDDGTDGAFRQTGLHDNQDKFNGVTSFKYYGEVLDPDLRNLAIATVGLGVRPTPKSSVDLVYHYYRQHNASDRLRGAAIDADPTGRHRSIGHGLDAIVGLRKIADFDAEFIFGVFLPGAAFSDRTDPAYFGGVELVYKF